MSRRISVLPVPVLLQKPFAWFVVLATAIALVLPGGLSFALCFCGEGVTVCSDAEVAGCCQPKCCDEESPAEESAAHDLAVGGCCECSRVELAQREPIGPTGGGTPQISKVAAEAPRAAWCLALAGDTRVATQPPPPVRPPPRPRSHRPLLI